MNTKNGSSKSLNTSKLSKPHVQNAVQTLSFENANDFIRAKFLNLTNFEEIDIYNFVIMEQLTQEDYSFLDTTFQELTHHQRILFDDAFLMDELFINYLKHIQKNTNSCL